MEREREGEREREREEERGRKREREEEGRRERGREGERERETLLSLIKFRFVYFSLKCQQSQLVSTESITLETFHKLSHFIFTASQKLNLPLIKIDKFLIICKIQRLSNRLNEI